jgi:hypothetical protein
MTTTTGPDVFVHELGPTGTFTLRMPAGDVDLQAVDGTTATVRDLDGRSIDERFSIGSGPGRLELRMRDRVSIGIGLLRGDNGRARIHVEVPRATGVVVETASAGIAAIGLERDQRYRTASGSIRVTGRGTMTVDSVSGEVAIDATDDIDLAARVVSGDIEAHGGRLRSAVVSTTSGDVLLDSALVGPGPYAIQTVSGDARLRAATGVRVEARTLTGEIEGSIAAAIGGRKGRKGGEGLVIGDGGTVLTFKSVSGDLRVSDARPASGAPTSQGAPEPPAPPEPPVAQRADASAPAPIPPDAPSPSPSSPAHATVDAAAEGDERLTVLRALEEGRIDVAEATRRLAALEGETDG